MKKILAILLALLMVLTLAGCSSSNTATETQTEETAEGKEYKIGICIYQFNDNFMTLYRNDIADYFDELNAKGGATYTYDIVDGKNDAATQTEQINTFIAQGVDALVVNLVQPSTIETVSDAAEAAGIPVVFINREPTDAEAHVYPENECYVGAKAQESGTYQGQIIYDLDNHGDLNGNGTLDYIMIMGDVNNTDAQYRTEYSIKYLTDNGMTVNELFKDTGNWDQVQGHDLVATQLAKYSNHEIDVVFCNNDAMALGAAQAITEAGLEVGKDIYLVGVDALDEAVEMVNAGTMTGTVKNDDLGQATACCDSVVAYLNGQTVETYQYIPYTMVTAK